jgi:hypothetical protein
MIELEKIDWFNRTILCSYWENSNEKTSNTNWYWFNIIYKSVANTKEYPKNKIDNG